MTGGRSDLAQAMKISPAPIPRAPIRPIRPLRGVHRRLRGFTLVELLMTLAVVAVLVTFAVPSFHSMLDSGKLTTASNALLSSIQLARSEAIRRGGRVVLCKSSDGLACAERGGWEQGWMVFHDANNDGERDRSEPVIQRMQPLAASLRLTGNSTVAKDVSFLSTGGGFQAGTLTVCNPSAGQARLIVLNAAGRPRIQKGSSTSCA